MTSYDYSMYLVIEKMMHDCGAGDKPVADEGHNYLLSKKLSTILILLSLKIMAQMPEDLVSMRPNFSIRISMIILPPNNHS